MWEEIACVEAAAREGGVPLYKKMYKKIKKSRKKVLTFWLVLC